MHVELNDFCLFEAKAPEFDEMYISIAVPVFQVERLRVLVVSLEPSPAENVERLTYNDDTSLLLSLKIISRYTQRKCTIALADRAVPQPYLQIFALYERRVQVFLGDFF